MSTETGASSSGVGQFSVGFIGAGMMATAIMDGLIARNVVPNAASISCSDMSERPLEMARAKGIYATTSNIEVCRRSKDAIIIAVKPNVVEEVCQDIVKASSSALDKDTDNNTDALILCVAAGITIQTLERCLPNRRVVRIMPNTPCIVGQSAAGYALGQHAADADRTIVQRIFGAVGIAIELKEFLLNAVTGLSGSGPAYVFEFIEALSDGGVRAGLTREVATQLAAQTVKGAAEMVLVTGEHPAVLKDRVTSPGGTTIAGCDELEKGGFRAAAIQAVKAATRRSMQLGGTPEDEIINKYGL